LPEMMFGWRANPHFGPFHLLSFALVGGGFILISVAGTGSMRRNAVSRWRPAARMRPCAIRNMSVSLVMAGFLIQWPTPLTIAMFRCWSRCMPPRNKKKETRARFGAAFDHAAQVPRFAALVASDGEIGGVEGGCGLTFQVADLVGEVSSSRIHRSFQVVHAFVATHQSLWNGRSDGC
jgi:hypothetical protein